MLLEILLFFVFLIITIDWIRLKVEKFSIPIVTSISELELDSNTNELKQKFIQKLLLNKHNITNVSSFDDGQVFFFDSSLENFQDLNFEFSSRYKELKINEFACDTIYLPLEKEEINQFLSILRDVYSNNIENKKESMRLNTIKTLKLAE